MTTLRTLVTRALRESGVIPQGTTPDATQMDEGLIAINDTIETVFGTELGENFNDINFGTSGLDSTRLGKDHTECIQSSYIPVNTRLIVNIDTATSLYLDPAPRDGSRISIVDAANAFDTSNLTLLGNGRKIEDSLSVTLSVQGVAREWFYRADLANWVRVTALTENDNSPFPSTLDALIVFLTAVRLNPRYGTTTDQETLLFYNRLKTILRAKYRQKGTSYADSFFSVSNGIQPSYSFTKGIV